MKYLGIQDGKYIFQTEYGTSEVVKKESELSEEEQLEKAKELATAFYYHMKPFLDCHIKDWEPKDH